MKRPLLGLYFNIILQGLTAQTVDPDQEDSIPSHTLEEIEISSEWVDPFVSASQLKKIALDQPATSLTDLLLDQTSIYFRNYGNQQLSSISMRGTSPSHTQVLWHGLPVNSPTLGQSDFSTWPAWLMGSLAIHSGNSSSLYGSGAIGGAVLINESNTVDPNPNWSAQLAQGSFGLWRAGLKAHYGFQKWSFSTALLHASIQNDFTIQSNRIREPLPQPHATVSNWGVDQVIDWKHEKHEVSAEIMHTVNDRQVQPGVLALTQRDTLKTSATRSAIEHRWRGDIWQAKTVAGWVVDETLFNDSLITPSMTWSLLHRSNIYIHPKWLTQWGGLIQHQTVQSDQLTTNATQTVTEPFVSIVHYPLPALALTASGRGLINTNNPIQWVPSLQASWQPGGFAAHFQWSQGYRYPTLNDLYWIPGGNTNLLPERSEQWELGAQWSHQHWQTEFSVYQIDTRDQILWLPNADNLWSPINLRKTQNRGAEGTISYTLKNKDFSSKTSISASYTEALVAPDQTQLPYVPRWDIQGIQQVKYNQWQLDLKPGYTGKRFTTIGENAALVLDSFFLLDLSVRYSADAFIKNKSLIMHGSIKNITNSYYELQSNLAMPGINYELQITIL